MKAFLDSPELAAAVRAQVQAHYDADEIIKGKYWEDGKGCAVGCIIHGSEHSRFESELGIPKDIAYLIDAIFEALPNGEAKEFPRRFVNAIRPGADLSMVIQRFLLWLLADPTYGVIVHARQDATKPKLFVTAVIALFDAWVRTGQRPTEDSALGRAAGAAWDAWAAWADLAARAAWGGLPGAAWAARAAWAVLGAARAPWAKLSADKLIELLAAAGE